MRDHLEPRPCKPKLKGSWKPRLSRTKDVSTTVVTLLTLELNVPVLLLWETHTIPVSIWGYLVLSGTLVRDGSSGTLVGVRRYKVPPLSSLLPRTRKEIDVTGSSLSLSPKFGLKVLNRNDSDRSSLRGTRNRSDIVSEGWVTEKKVLGIKGDKEEEYLHFTTFKDQMGGNLILHYKRMSQLCLSFLIS